MTVLIVVSVLGGIASLAGAIVYGYGLKTIGDGDRVVSDGVILLSGIVAAIGFCALVIGTLEIHRKNQGCFRHYPNQYVIEGRTYYAGKPVVVCPMDGDE